MNKYLLLCLLMALSGQTYAQKDIFQIYNKTQSSESIQSGSQVPLLEKDKAASPALQQSEAEENSYITSQSSIGFPDYWPDRLFIMLKDGQNGKLQTFETKVKRPKVTAGDKLNGAIQRHQAASVAELPRLQKGTSSRNAVYQVVLDKPDQLQSLIQELNALPEVEYVERVPLYVTFQAPNDPEYIRNNQYAINRTKAVDASGIHTGSTRTLLAIVDDAVLISHPDLAANVDGAKSYDVADNDADPSPPSSGPNKAGPSTFSHGTHCAGIAGSVTNNGVGVAAISNNRVNIIGVKTTRDNASSSRVIEYPIEGIIYALNQGARVISMSFGGSGYSQTMQNIINEATANGVVFVAAAGNSNTETKMYPAAYANVIAVASTDANDLKSSFSNFGTWIDVSAPGSGILSTVTASDGISGAYTYYSGTSMACPMVASQIALMLSQNPSLTPQAVLHILKTTADPIDNVANQSPSLAGKLGSGRINAFRAIQAIQGISNTVAPAAITNLQVIRAGQTELEIQWSAPDAGGAAATLYDIRYSSAPITADNFEAAIKSRQNIFPDQPGRTQKLIIKGLVPSTTHYIAIVSKSLYGDASPLSNVASLSTLPAPVIQVNPNSYNLSLNRASSSTISGNFTLTNQGIAQLNYAAALVPVTGSNISAFDKKKMTADNAVGLGGGGFLTAVKFTAGGTGFNLTHVQNYLNSSTTTANLPIGIQILKGGTNPANATLISSETFSRSVPAGGRVFTFPLQAPQRFASGEVFWIVFVLPNGLDFPQGFDNVGSMPATFFLSTNNGSSYADAQTLANFLANAAFNIRAVNADWITLNFLSGSVPPGQATDVILSFNVPNTVPDGIYQMHVSFSSNDPVSPIVNRPVTLTVTGSQSKFVMEPEQIDFGTLFVGSSRTTRFVVSNAGSATLTVKAEGVNLGAFAVTDFAVDRKSTVSLAPGSQREIPVVFTPSRQGVLKGTLTLSTNDPAASTVTVPVVANVVAPPVAAVTPAVLNFELEPDSITTASDKFTVQNNGEADLNYTLEVVEAPKWLTVAPGANLVAAGDQVPNTVKVNAAGLEKGIYKGRIQVLSNDPDQPIITVEVKMQVEDSPVAGFRANLTEVTSGEEVKFINSSENADVYEWEFEGAEPASSILASPVVAYTIPGKYKVSLKAKSTQTGRSSEALVKEEYIVVQNTLCYELNSPFTGIELLATTDDGYITGNNKHGDKAKANYFNFNRPDAYVTGIKVKFGSAVAASPDATITVAIWEVNASNGEPQNILTSKEMKLADVIADIASGRVTDVVFDAPVRLTGSFFAGVLLNTEVGNSVAIVHNDHNETLPGIAWTQDNQSNWAALGAIWQSMANIALYIQPVVTQTLTPLVANFTVTSESVCVGQQVQLDASSTVGAVRYEWLLEGANTTTSTAVNPMASYATAGTYKVTLKAYNSCSGVIVLSKIINVVALPDAAVTITGSTTLCDGEKVTLSAVAGDDFVYSWSNGATTRSIEVSTSGEYIVTVTNVNKCTTTSEAVVVKVNSLPIARIVTNGSTTFCEGEKVELSAPAGDEYTYRWSNGATTRSIKIGTAGDYTVTVTNANGCASTSEAVVVRVNALPVAQITASGATTFCQGNNVILTASEGNTYLWSNGATTRSISVVESGNYTVSVKNSNGCAATSHAIQIIVNPLPDKPLVYQDDIILTSTAATGNQWFRNNIAIPGATGPIYEATKPGVYQVLVTSASGCASEISEEMNITEIDLVTNLQVYPIPGNGLFNITFTGLKPDKVSVQVFDVTGKLIYEGKKNMLDERKFQIDISTAAAGVYMLQIQNNIINYSRRLVVQH